MNLIPMPKKIELYEGFLQKKQIRFTDKTTDIRLLKAFDKLPQSSDGIKLKLYINKGETEKYALKIETERIIIEADSNAGAFYAIQTLRQLFESDKVPCCYIEDAPDFEYRGFYHDITRGKVPTVETLKRLIDDMAYYKLNSLQLYVEHTFAFKEYADSIERTGYLTAEEIKEIDEYCKLNFIEFIPSLSTFGHLYELLQKDRYKHLCEIENFEAKEFFWENRMLHHTIDPTKDESFELIKSLIDQYSACFSSDKFNICCDETFDLKNGRHKDGDTGKLYIDFVIKIIKYLQSKGKKVMMWADILLNYPEQIDSLPEGVELLNWCYWKDIDENTFKIIKAANRPQIVCPGTGTWSRLCEDYGTETVNICKMAEYGYKYGAKGVLNTNWGDWGNPCSIELAMFGLVLGAEKSWNVSSNADDDFVSGINVLLYHNADAVPYIKRLSDTIYVIDWYIAAKCYANILCGKIYDVEFPDEKVLRENINECFNITEDIKNGNWEDNRFKEQLLIAAEGTAVIGEIIMKLAGYSAERKTNTTEWLEKYSESWLKYNKQSELCEIQKMFTVLENE